MSASRWTRAILTAVLVGAPGCSLIPRSESCSAGASCIPLIEWDGAVFYQVGSRGAVIEASDTRALGDLGAGAPLEAADGVVLALQGVDPSRAVAMRADAGTEVAPGVTVDYLIFVREAEFPATLCPYFVADPPADPVPPQLPEICR